MWCGGHVAYENVGSIIIYTVHCIDNAKCVWEREREYLPWKLLCYLVVYIYIYIYIFFGHVVLTECKTNRGTTHWPTTMKNCSVLYCTVLLRTSTVLYSAVIIRMIDSACSETILVWLNTILSHQTSVKACHVPIGYISPSYSQEENIHILASRIQSSSSVRGGGRSSMS